MAGALGRDSSASQFPDPCLQDLLGASWRDREDERRQSADGAALVKRVLSQRYRNATDWCKELEGVKNWTLTFKRGSLFHKLFNRCVEKYSRTSRKSIRCVQKMFQTICGMQATAGKTRRVRRSTAQEVTRVEEGAAHRNGIHCCGRDSTSGAGGAADVAGGAGAAK
jgi:hypothetical protein